MTNTTTTRSSIGAPAPAAAAHDLDAWLANLVSAIRPAERADATAVQAHLDQLTKPIGSLGRLERLALRLALICGDPPPALRRRTVLVLAGDHGVAAQGVSAYPAEVTAQMCRNYASGGAAINAIARSVGADVLAVDVGVAADPAALALPSRKVRWGTADLSLGPAMSRAEALRAVRVGAELVEECLDHTDVFALGEMGIGNTTSAAALTAALCDASAEMVVGSGTGIGSEALERKRRIVEEAAKRVEGVEDAVTVLAAVGGLEVAGLVGAVLAVARVQRPVIADGFITTAAVLVAARLAPASLHYVFAAHRSLERGHALQLGRLGLEPILDLELRLGEGTGAALALPIVDAAGAILRDMSTFAAAGVSEDLDRG